MTSPDRCVSSDDAMKRRKWVWGVVLSAAAAARAADPEEPPIGALLSLLARRAALYESVLYRFECVEDIRLERHRRDASGEMKKRESMGVRQRILVEKGREGEPKEVRLAMDRDDGARLDKNGRPVEVRLPDEFAPVATAFPHAQVAWFTAAKQKGLRFEVVGESMRERRPHHIECRSPADIALEFLDAEPLRWRWASTLQGTKCDGRASGQMCLEAATGEITAVEFYGTTLVDHGCVWDFAHPFARIELEFTEAKTGLRFPTRVETVVPRGRDVEVFTQRFLDYAFASVQVEERLGGTVLPQSR